MCIGGERVAGGTVALSLSLHHEGFKWYVSMAPFPVGVPRSTPRLALNACLAAHREHLMAASVCVGVMAGAQHSTKGCQYTVDGGPFGRWA